MANSILTPTAVTRRALEILHQKANFIGSINRQYDDSFANSGAKIGDSLRIRKPNEYTVRTGAVMDVQDTEETSVTLQVATQKGVDTNFTSDDLTLDLDDFSERILEPAMSVLAANIEADVMNVYKDVWNEYADVGDAVALADVLYVSKILDDNLAPRANRSLNLDTLANLSLVSANSTLFNDPAKISRQYREGRIGGDFLGFQDVYQNTLWPIHTTGTDDGTGDYLVNQTSWTQGDTTATIDTGAGTWKQGDIFSFGDGSSNGNVLRVHPESKASTGIGQQYVVTADVGTSATSIAFQPPIYTTGGRQNITHVPDNNAPLHKEEWNYGTDIGASADYQVCMGYHRDAFTIATADLVMPNGVDFAAREVFDGISMRIVRQYDINNDKFPCRLDVLYGYKAIRPEWACRLGHD